MNISSSGVGINTSSAAASLLEVSGGFVTADGIGRYKGHSAWDGGATKTIVADLPDGMYQVVAVATDENWYLVAWVTMRSGTGEVRATICNQYVTAGFSGDDLQLTNGQPAYGVTIYWAVTSFTGGA